MPREVDRDFGGGVQLSWQNIIMTVGLVLSMVGGFWYLAYIPIQRTFDDLKQQVIELRNMENHRRNEDEQKYLTQKEHNEFKSNVHATDEKFDKEMQIIRKEAATRAEIQQAQQLIQQSLNTTRVEFLAEIKRLDDLNKNSMKRNEFDIWKSERDKLIAQIQDRQNRFSEALDAMYSKLMMQVPFFQQNRQQ